MLGYLIYCAHAMSQMFTYFGGFFGTLTVFICPCVYLEAMCADLKETFVEFDQMVAVRPQDQTELKRNLIETIEFHANIYRCV